ncbi:MAG TPA: hypothetical protein VJ874_06355 [Candidatus Thermoplasmatota archaeon]|nr:hypothetical protein [Candidatus Thermoplasmatota archaeon]
MRTPQARLGIGGCEVLLVGTVPGFAPDGERVEQAFGAFLPDCVALGVPAEDLVVLEKLATADPKPELPMPDEATQRLLELLADFGPTAIPSPDLERATALARGRGLALAALDLDDAEHATLYTKHVKFRHVVQSNSIKRRLLKDGVAGADAYALADAWDAAWTRPKGLREVEEARERHMARRLHECAAEHRRILAVLPAPRLAGVLRLLQGVPMAASPAGAEGFAAASGQA